MIRIERFLFISMLVLFICPITTLGAGKANRQSKSVDWNPIMEAIIQVESGGDANARSGKSVGVMQITPVLVEDCNLILERKKSKKRYSLSDRFSVQKSKEMFLLIQSWYNPSNNVEKAIRLWNGGVNYSVKKTQRYFEKVMKAMK